MRCRLILMATVLWEGAMRAAAPVMSKRRTTVPAVSAAILVHTILVHIRIQDCERAASRTTPARRRRCVAICKAVAMKPTETTRTVCLTRGRPIPVAPMSSSGMLKNGGTENNDHGAARSSAPSCFGKEAVMDLCEAPAFVAAKMALLSDARAAAATRATRH